MRILSLFSGIGGIDLAAQWAGMETVAFCEIEPYCQKVLAKHWPGVPIFPDVKQLTKKALEESGVLSGGPIEIVAGGYPCQPFSLAGNRQGEDDDRHLWPEVKRILSEVQPSWFVGENVVGHVTLGLDQVLSDLEGEGFSSQPFIIPSCAVGAVHKRERIFIVANSTSKRWDSISKVKQNRCSGGGMALREFEEPPRKEIDTLLGFSRVLPEPISGILRNDNGLSEGLDRLKSLGNAVVPQQIYPIFAAIKSINHNAPR